MAKSAHPRVGNKMYLKKLLALCPMFVSFPGSIKIAPYICPHVLSYLSTLEATLQKKRGCDAY